MPATVSTDDDCQYDATVESVLCALDRWTARNDGHHTEKRKARRFALRAPVTVVTQFYGSGAAVRIEAYSRNISVSGLAFVVPKRIRVSDQATDVLATTVLPPDSVIRVNVDRQGHDLRLVAKICRLRKVHDDLYECGVQFLGRDEAEPVAQSPADEPAEVQTDVAGIGE